VVVEAVTLQLHQATTGSPDSRTVARSSNRTWEYPLVKKIALALMLALTAVAAATVALPIDPAAAGGGRGSDTAAPPSDDRKP
jgi:hypothetical protein